jgi:hypothetical protein
VGNNFTERARFNRGRGGRDSEKKRWKNAAKERERDAGESRNARWQCRLGSGGVEGKERCSKGLHHGGKGRGGREMNEEEGSGKERRR